jgi:hypothetical protein
MNKACLPNTREDLLKEIKDWIKSTDDARKIFFLTSVAGMYKLCPSFLDMPD